MRLDRALAIGQGAYFAATGLWALVDVDSFQLVTGPKTDALLLAARRGRVERETRVLAAGSAIALVGAWIVASIGQH